MSFPGLTVNTGGVPLIPQQQIVIPPINIPQGLSATPLPPQSQTIIQLRANGREAAKNIPLGPNSEVAIFDSAEDSNLFYYRKTDASGQDTVFKTCSYSELEDPPEPQYLTVQEFYDAMDKYTKTLREELANGKFIRTDS